MSIAAVKVKAAVVAVHSIYTGVPVFTDEGPTEGDDSVLFTYVGEAGTWEHVHPKVLAALKLNRDDLEDLSPEDVCKRLTIPGAVCIEFDGGWSGQLWVAFAPAEAEE